MVDLDKVLFILSVLVALQLSTLKCNKGIFKTLNNLTYTVLWGILKSNFLMIYLSIFINLRYPNFDKLTYFEIISYLLSLIAISLILIMLFF